MLAKFGAPKTYQSNTVHRRRVLDDTSVMVKIIIWDLFCYASRFRKKLQAVDSVGWWFPQESNGAGIIYLHEWLIFMVKVGKYTSSMDPMGLKAGVLTCPSCRAGFLLGGYLKCPNFMIWFFSQAAIPQNHTTSRTWRPKTTSLFTDVCLFPTISQVLMLQKSGI